MPREIDQEKIEGSDLPTLDINNPPTRVIAHQSYPKIVYLHPKDKTKEHIHKVVNNEAEHEAAEKQGFKTKPHIPVEPEPDYSEDFETTEYEGASETVPEKRGPGRPKVAA